MPWDRIANLISFSIAFFSEEILYLYSNELTGTIPTEIGSLKQAEKITLHFNRLDGTMPEQVCNLTDDALTALTVSCGLSSGPECDCCIDCVDL